MVQACVKQQDSRPQGTTPSSKAHHAATYSANGLSVQNHGSIFKSSMPQLARVLLRPLQHKSCGGVVSMPRPMHTFTSQAQQSFTRKLSSTHQCQVPVECMVAQVERSAHRQLLTGTHTSCSAAFPTTCWPKTSTRTAPVAPACGPIVHNSSSSRPQEATEPHQLHTHSNSVHRAMWSDAYARDGRAEGPISFSFSIRQREMGRRPRPSVHHMWSMMRLLSPLDLNFHVENSPELKGPPQPSILLPAASHEPLVLGLTEGLDAPLLCGPAPF